MKIKLMTISFAIGVLFAAGTAQAEGFVVNPILTQEQTDEQKSYFYEKATPGQTKEFTIQIKNKGTREETFTVKAVDAYSNPLSFMEYTIKKQTQYSYFLDERYRFTSLFEQTERIVQVKPGETKNVTFKGKINEEIKEGQILGAFQVEQSTDTSPKEKINSGEATVELSVKKRFTIGAVMEITKQTEPLIKIMKTEVKMEGKLPKLVLELHNLTPYITDNLLLEYQIYDKNNKLLFEDREELYSLAPATTMNIPLKWSYKDFEAGNYRLEAMVTTDKNVKFKYVYESDFDIEQITVDKYAEQNPGDAFFFPRAIERIPIIYFNLMAFLIIGVIYFYRKRKTKKDA